MTAPADSDGPRAIAAALDDPAAPPPAAIGARQARRFAIYRNNLAHAMVEAMRASFPVVERLVGAAFFAALARAYLAAEPPRSPLLFRMGGGFAAFIEGFPPARRVPYLADVARLEWLRLEAHHAGDAEPVGLAALAALPPEAMEGARLRLHPSLGLLASRWPVVSIRAASAETGQAGAGDMDAPEDAAGLRPGLAVRVHRLAPGTGAFLAALAAGRSLAGAAGAGAEGARGFDLPAALGEIFAMGAVTGIAAPGGPEHEGIPT